jgi:hypothetical protein
MQEILASTLNHLIELFRDCPPNPLKAQSAARGFPAEATLANLDRPE